MPNNPNDDWFIPSLCKTLLRDPSPKIRILAVQTLMAIDPLPQEAIDTLTKAIANDLDESVRASIIQAIQTRYASQSMQPMSERLNVQMTFNAPVYGAVGNLEGDQIISASAPDFEALLADYKQFFNDLQQRYPAQVPDSALPAIIEAEFQEIKKTQPQRWQNFLSLKRLWNGGTRATFKLGEHFTEESVWGKMAIAFLEGILEEIESD